MSPRLLGCLLALVAALAPAIASAQQDPRPVVLVVDPGRARVSGDRLLRAVASATSRVVVRITDERARDPAGTLTLAYEGTATWLVRYESRGRSALVHERITRPGLLDGALAAASARMIAEVERAPEPAADRTPARDDRADDHSLYIAWADEILDPFAGMPPPRRELAVIGEVIDPFAPAAARRAAWSEVLDPWSP